MKCSNCHVDLEGFQVENMCPICGTKLAAVNAPNTKRHEENSIQKAPPIPKDTEIRPNNFCNNYISRPTIAMLMQMNDVQRERKPFCLFAFDEIPRDMLLSATESFACEIDPNDVVLLFAGSPSKTVKTGLLVTSEYVYWKDDNSAGRYPTNMIRDFVLSRQFFIRTMDMDILPEPQLVFVGHSSDEVIANLALEYAKKNCALPTSKQNNLQFFNPPLIGELIEEYTLQENKEILSFYVGNSIPHAKLLNAIKSYAQDISPCEVIYLFDATVFGNAKKGLIITPTSIYWKGMFGEGSIPVNDVYKFFWKNRLFIEMNDGTIITDTGFGSDSEYLLDYLNRFVFSLKEHGFSQK